MKMRVMTREDGTVVITAERTISGRKQVRRAMVKTEKPGYVQVLELISAEGLRLFEELKPPKGGTGLERSVQ